jgi:hypothetical protein
MLTNNIDLVLFGALVVDIFLKQRRLNKVKKQMIKYNRYQRNTTTLKYVIYSINLFLSVVYLFFRIYTIIKFKGFYVFPPIMILIPLIDYYILLDWFIGGIYYNSRGIYYKSEYYEYRRANYIYRDLIKGMYEYEVSYRIPKSGDRIFTIKIPDEKEAYPLLASIPFKKGK